MNVTKTIWKSLMTVAVVSACLALGAGIAGAILTLIVAAVVLLLADRFLPGLEVSGFGGAIIAAIAMA